MKPAAAIGAVFVVTLLLAIGSVAGAYRLKPDLFGTGPSQAAAADTASRAAAKADSSVAPDTASATLAAGIDTVRILRDSIAAMSRAMAAEDAMVRRKPAPRDTVDMQAMKQRAKLLEAMSPEEAARLIGTMPEREARAVILAVKKRQAGKILGAMEPRLAARLIR